MVKLSQYSDGKTALYYRRRDVFMKKLSVFLLAMSLCLSSVLAGCGGSGGGDKTSGDVAQKPVEQTSQVQQGEQVSNEPHGTLRYTSSGAITTLNPHTYTATSDGSAIEQTSVKLYKFFPGDICSK